MPLVKMRPAVGGAAGLQAADGAGQGEHPRVGLGRERIASAGRCRSACGRRFAVVGSQHIEAAVLAADPDDLRRLAVDVDRVDLGRVADRLILVLAFLGVVGAHRVGPDIAGIDLRDPALLAGVRIESDDCARFGRVQAGLSGVGWRGAVFTSVPKKSVLVSASYDGVHQTCSSRGRSRNLCLPQLSLIDDRRVERLRLGADIVLPDDLAVSGSSAITKPRPLEAL